MTDIIGLTALALLVYVLGFLSGAAIGAWLLRRDTRKQIAAGVVAFDARAYRVVDITDPPKPRGPP